MANKNELLTALEEAQEKLFEAIEQIEWYCDEAGDENARAYVLNHLKIMTSSDHGFIDSSTNVGDLMDKVRGIGEYAEPPECGTGQCNLCPDREMCGEVEPSLA